MHTLQDALDALHVAERNLAKVREILTAIANPGQDEEVPDSAEVDKRKVIDEWFERECWPLTWRKDNKAAALRKVRRHATTPEIRDAIIRGMRAQRDTFLQREEKYRPHLVTWMNQERWKDEALAPVVRTPLLHSVDL